MIDIRHLEPGDCASMVACFRACYGETYANPDFYDAALLQQRIAAGSLRSVVAVAGDTVVGHTGLTVSHRQARAAEAGNTVVHPEYRGKGLLGRLGEALRDRTLADGFVGYVHYPTTAHDIMQRQATSGTGRETGIMLAYIPGATDYSGFAGSGDRLAATVVYQPLAPAPSLTIALPDKYRDLISSLAARVGLDRQALAPALPGADPSRVAVSQHRSRGLTQIVITAIGTDLEACLEDHLRSAEPVVHVDICLDDPAVAHAVDSLLALGFTFCAWLPYQQASDVLRLQRVAGLTDRERTPALVTTQAGALLDFMLDGEQDWTQPATPTD